MSIIYADTCKHCCHINNCVAKIVTEKAYRAKCRQQSAWSASHESKSYTFVVIDVMLGPMKNSLPISDV